MTPRDVSEIDRLLELFHRLWAEHSSGRPYDRDSKRRWCECLDKLQALAGRGGYYEALHRASST